MPANTAASILARIEIGAGPCGGWRFPNDTRNGYGQVKYHGKNWLAHRLIYTLIRGPIPDGMQLDHVCHSSDPTCPGNDECEHRRCVYPAHLEIITQEEHNRRHPMATKTECKNGHDLTDPANWAKNPGGWRDCRQCRNERHRRRRAAARAAREVA